MPFTNTHETTKRVLIHSQNGAGLDGAHCTLAITHHWARLYNDVSFLIFTDLGKFNCLEVPQHVDYIHVPTNGHKIASPLLRHRALTTTLAHFDPHILVIHCSSDAVLQHSSHQLAHYVRQNHPQMELVLGLWQPPQQRQFASTDWHKLPIYETLNTLYDQIWFYSPSSVVNYRQHTSYQAVLSNKYYAPQNGQVMVNGH